MPLEMPRVLCVDDEPMILRWAERVLEDDYDVALADGGPAALELMAGQPPFDVIVSDMRMPGMTGAVFLAEARQQQPEAVRLLLTGQSEMDDAISAVNDGGIFQFLTKPCEEHVFMQAVATAVEHHSLLVAERQLVELTLSATVEMLTDALGLVHSPTFARSNRIRSYVSQLAELMELTDTWELEIAAMLSHLGCIAIPVETLERSYADQPLSDEDAEMMAAHPSIAAELIGRIPRLEKVGAIIGRLAGLESTDDHVVRRGEILAACVEFDGQIQAGATVADAARHLEALDRHDAELIAAFQKVEPTKDLYSTGTVELSALRDGMLIDQPVRTDSGKLLIGAGVPVNLLLRQRLTRHAISDPVEEPLRVLVPRRRAVRVL